MKKVISIVAIALMALSSAFAQENNNRDENGNIVRGPYLTNEFGDNWFINVGAGVNGVLSQKDVKSGIGGFALDFSIGKWFTPSVGARFGYRGVKNSFDVKSGYKTQIDAGSGEWDAQHYVHGDLLWNVSNAFSGYKETRFWDVIPYATTGWLGLKSDYYMTLNGDDRKVEDEWVVGAGILNKFRLSDRIGLYIDLSVLSTRHEVLAISPRAKNNYIFTYLPTAVAGITFNLGRTNWDRLSSVQPTVVAPSISEADYKALQSRLADMELKNKSLAEDLEAAKNVKPETVVVKTEGKKQIVLFFEIAKNNLRENEIGHLRAFASQLTPDAKLTVIGSADSGTGNESINTRLAEARAQVVVDVLVKEFGLSRENITIDHTFDIFGNNPYSRATLIE